MVLEYSRTRRTEDTTMVIEVGHASLTRGAMVGAWRPPNAAAYAVGVRAAGYVRHTMHRLLPSDAGLRARGGTIRIRL